ncbi:MAG: hypothetical protein JXR03_09390 [Cyclobacteriaceae bacterium]
MAAPCVTGKIIYESREMAEEALVEAWIRNDYRVGTGPVAVYQCHDCKRYHFTSQGTMNDFLKEKLDRGYIATQKRARDWERRF